MADRVIAWADFRAQFDDCHVSDDRLIAAFNIAWHAAHTDREETGQ